VVETLDLAPVEVAAPTSRGRVRVVVVLALIGVAVLALVSQGLLHSLNYFETVDQALAQRATLGSREIRLEGVVTAPVTRSASGADFLLAGSRGTIRVAEVGSPPQLFQENIPVVVVGHFASASATVFHATQIMVKHTATYIAQHPSRVRARNGSVR
jgi:cytochrome c-type biogenesis protein CcmE